MSTFSLKQESKSPQHGKENLFELCLNGYISMKCNQQPASKKGNKYFKLRRFYNLFKVDSQ